MWYTINSKGKLKKVHLSGSSGFRAEEAYQTLPCQEGQPIEMRSVLGLAKTNKGEMANNSTIKNDGITITRTLTTKYQVL